MRPARVVSLLRRRGSVLLWEHAIPASKETLDSFTGNPKLSAGGRRPSSREIGNMGESFYPPYSVQGYLQSKITTTFNEVFGMVDDRTMQLDVPSLLVPDSSRGIIALPDYLSVAYSAGKFVTHEHGKPLARDRFTILGIRYVVKSSAVPIIDGNVTQAWRMLVSADTL